MDKQRLNTEQRLHRNIQKALVMLSAAYDKLAKHEASLAEKEVTKELRKKVTALNKDNNKLMKDNEKKTKALTTLLDIGL